MVFVYAQSVSTHLSCNEMPCFGIANNYCVRTSPLCLQELTEVGLAMPTPIKTFGYCFSYTGGQNKQLQGSLSYFKVEIESIVKKDLVAMLGTKNSKLNSHFC